MVVRFDAAARPVDRDVLDRDLVVPDFAFDDRERVVVDPELGFPEARRVDDPADVRFAAAVEPRAVDLGLMGLRINRISHISLAHLTSYVVRV